MRAGGFRGTSLALLLFFAGLSRPALAVDPQYEFGLLLGSATSGQNAAGAGSETAFAFGAGGTYWLAPQWGVGAEVLTSKPFSPLRVSSFLFSGEYRADHLVVGAILGMQSLIDDRAGIAYIDPFTGRVVRDSDDGFTFGAKVGYEFLIPLGSPNKDIVIEPSVRYLRSTGNSFFNQLYAMIEIKFLVYVEDKPAR